MRIEITKDLLLEYDGTCYTVSKRGVVTGESTRGRKAKPENIGKITENVLGYYPTLAQALTRVRDMSLTGTETIDALMARLAASDQAIRETAERINHDTPHLPDLPVPPGNALGD
jgi:hypothetical protein